MDFNLADWLNLAVRWLHITAGIAWIGSSFFFNWLEGRLHPPAEPEPGVGGESWMVHGGGFYHTRKFVVAPARLPGVLHWFKWEAYVTWLSGFALLILVYYLHPGTYLLAPDGPVTSPALGIAIAVGAMALGWVVYDGLCRSLLGRHSVAFALVGVVLVSGLAYGLQTVFGGRAAYLHVGAVIGTIMAANVFMVIIPNQRKLVAALLEGREPEAILGQRGQQRSLHNNYLTLPVLFVMISNHYPFTFGHGWGWALLVAIAVIGAGVRHFFNLRNRGRDAYWIWPAAALAMIAVAIAAQPPKAGGQAGAVAFEDIRVIIAARCQACHVPKPTFEGFDAPPGGIVMDSPRKIRALAPRINAQAGITQAMPPGNVTRMTDDERAAIRGWFAAGAPINSTKER